MVRWSAFLLLVASLPALAAIESGAPPTAVGPPSGMSQALRDGLAPAGVSRIAGVERTATSAAISRRMFDEADAVVLASAEDFPDALSAAPLAAAVGGPLLLSPSNRLTAPVREELQRLDPGRVDVIGGEGAISAAVEQAVAELGVDEVRRIAGAGRFDTAARVAQEGVGRAETVVLASGFDWPDALSVAPLAAELEMPILLTTPDGLPVPTIEALQEMGVKNVVIVGGRAAVGDVVAGDLDHFGVASARISGATRWKTSKRIAEAGMWSGLDARRTWLASGHSWPDALAGGAAVAHERGVLQLVDGGRDRLEGEAATLVRGWGAELTDVVLLGGEGVISEGVEDDVRQAAGTKPAPGEFQLQRLEADDGAVRLELGEHAAADRYEVRSLDGDVLHEGSQPQFALDSEDGAQAVRVLALEDDEVRARRDVRLAHATLREAADGAMELEPPDLAASRSADQVVLSWALGEEPAQPIKVVRFRVDPEADTVPLVERKVLGYTCGSDLTDPSPALDDEHAYQLVRVPREVALCDGASLNSDPPESPVVLGSVRMPPLEEVPDGGPGTFSAEEGAGFGERPSRTVVERAIASQAGGSDVGGTAGAHQPEDWPPFLLRYQTFIAEEFHPRETTLLSDIPGVDAESSDEYVKGDMGERGTDSSRYGGVTEDEYNPRAPYRTRVDIETTFGSDGEVTFEHDISDTIVYRRDQDGRMHYDRTVEHSQPNVLEFHWIEHEGDAARFRFEHDVGNPLPFFDQDVIEPPSIYWQLLGFYSEGHSVVGGQHAKAPHHEIWVGPVPGPFVQVYGRENVGLHCLSWRTDWGRWRLPGCTEEFSARL